jgi:ribonuclease HI
MTIQPVLLIILSLPESVIFTDGSSSPKSKRGGWASIVMLPTHFVELVGYADDTTNNRMEMMAAIQGLKELSTPHEVYLVSDSAYLLNSIQNRWYNRWFADEEFFDNAYAKEIGRFPRPNLDLWRVVSSLDQFHTIIPVKVKGHSGHEWNDRVDRLALSARTDRIAHRRELLNGYDSDEERFYQIVRNGTGVLVKEKNG